MAAPLMSREMTVEKQWIDYNGHMNMAFYGLLADRGADDAFEAVGMGEAYARSRRLTTYSAELHVCYIRELHLGDRVNVGFQLIAHDEKRLHSYQEIRHVDGWLAATAEMLTLHIDMTGPKVTPFPPDVLAAIEAMRAEHDTLPVPERVGRTIGIRKK